MATRSNSKFTARGDGLQRLLQLGQDLRRRPAVKVGVFAATAIQVRPAKTKVRRRTTTTRTTGYGVSKETRITSVEHEGPSAGGRSSLTNLEIAIVNHFGTLDGHVPGRPFLTQTADAKRGAWLGLLEKVLLKVVKGALTLRDALELVGMQAAADVKRTIRAGMSPPNAESTIKAKGSSKPLINTGQLLNGISHQVEGA